MKENIQSCLRELESLINLNLAKNYYEGVKQAGFSSNNIQNSDDEIKNIRGLYYNKFIQELRKQNTSQKSPLEPKFFESIQNMIREKLVQQNQCCHKKRGRPVKSIEEEIQLGQWILQQKRKRFSKLEIKKQFERIRGTKVTALSTARIMRILNRSNIEGVEIVTKCIGRKQKRIRPAEEKNDGEDSDKNFNEKKEGNSNKLLQSPQSYYIPIQIQLSEDESNGISKYLNTNEQDNLQENQVQSQEMKEMEWDRNENYNPIEDLIKEMQ